MNPVLQPGRLRESEGRLRNRAAAIPPALRPSFSEAVHARKYLITQQSWPTPCPWNLWNLQGTKTAVSQFMRHNLRVPGRSRYALFSISFCPNTALVSRPEAHSPATLTARLKRFHTKSAGRRMEITILCLC